MIMDRTGLLSDRQAITATSASTHVIDLGASDVPPFGSATVRDIGKGTSVPLAFAVPEAFNNLTSLTVALQVDDNEAFSSPREVYTRTIAVADLTPTGRHGFADEIPAGTDERFLRALYTVAGTAPTTGRVTLGVCMGVNQ